MVDNLQNGLLLKAFMSYARQIGNFDAECEHAYLNPSTCFLDEFQNTRKDLSLLSSLAVRSF